MKIKFVGLVLWLVFGLLWGQRVSAANALVGDGTPASCSEAAFDSALAAAASGGGVITFNCGPASATITFTGSKIVTGGDVTINGNGRIILDAGNTDRHFFVGNGVTFRLQNITLRGGNSAVGGGAVEASGANVVLEGVQLLNNSASTGGGAIYCFDGTLTIANSVLSNNSAGTGGAIFNDGCVVQVTNSTFDGNRALDAISRGGAIENGQPGTLTITNSLLQNNSALDGGGLYVASGATAILERVSLQTNSGGYGGGLENSGTTTLKNSLVDGNTVTGSGGGLWNLGGTLIVRQTTVSNNSGYEGGGVNSYGSHLEMTDVNIVDNKAVGGHGGGLYHSGGTAFVSNATISGNLATDPAANGGGIFQNSNDNLTLTNATLANNQAGLLGGGFYHYGRYAVLTNVTIANNVAGTAGAAIYEDSPMTPANPGLVQLINSVILGSANNCDGSVFQSLGHNISSGTCAALNDPTDQENYAGDLLLGPLVFNGGSFAMQTLLPQTGSPLIDAADTGQCPSVDQRSAARVGACDIGAAEYGAVVSRVYLPAVVR